MKKLNWWTSSELSRMQAINEHSDVLARLEANEANLLNELPKFLDNDRAQVMEIARLRAVVGALVELLVRNQVIDPDDLENLGQKALDELDAGMPRPAPPTGGPYR